MNATVKLFGTVSNANGEPLEAADVQLMDRKFEPLFQTKTDSKGHYELLVPVGVYSFFFACKDYGTNNLEYWSQDLPLDHDMQLNAVIDKLEIYGLHAFVIRGAAPGFSLYFRPMSLEKALNKEEDICPNISSESVQVWIDQKPVTITAWNEVKEHVGPDAKVMKAFLIQVRRPEGVSFTPGQSLQVLLEIKDQQTGAKGQASRFFVY